MSTDQVKITIDGKIISAAADRTILEAALGAGINIPHLCYLKGLKPYGGCRLCIVKVAGMRGYPSSCTTRVAEGMAIESDTEEINAIRRNLCQMLIADHPEDCLQCSANQKCELQRVAAYLGIRGQKLRRSLQPKKLDQSNPFYTRDLEKCIRCARCVRTCNEVLNIGAIALGYRGHESAIVAPDDGPISESTCTSCGGCVAACPVGALHAKNEVLEPGREITTICPYCGCGCQLIVGVRNNKIVSVKGKAGKHAPNHGQLCVKGRFGLGFAGSPDRLTKPLIRKNGKLVESSWDESLELVASKFSALKKKHGADSLAGLSSAKCTNEDNYVLQKFVRACLGTNNIDHCARLCHASTVAGLARAFGSGAMTNSIDELSGADCIFVIGSNTTEAHPIVAIQIKKAVVENGAKLIVADPRTINLVDFSVLHLKQRSGSDVMLINAMMNVIITEKLADQEFIAKRTEGFAEIMPQISACTPENASLITGLTPAEIRSAARIYAAADKASIVYSMGITQHTTGTDNVLALANLALLTGNIGRESTGINPLRGQNNVQGACDLGALPNVYPGYQKVADKKVQQKFSKAWQAKLSNKPGLTVVEILHACETGKIKGIYIMGENPAVSDPNTKRAKKALQAADFIVVQDIFLTETAKLADVVLPSSSFAEKAGTFTNTERRVQNLQPCLKLPGESRLDWQIICDISTKMDYKMQYKNDAEIMAEIAKLTPIYGGISHKRLKTEVLQWPCPDFSHQGTKFLHQNTFSQGKGKFHPTPFREAAELPDKKYPLLLTTGRLLYHFHTGTMSRKVDGLNAIAPGSVLEMHPQDAKKLKLKNKGKVKISSRRGSIEVTLGITDAIRKGTVFLPFHFAEAAANILTNDALDPVAKIPEFKVCAVKVLPAEKKKPK